MGFNIGIDIGGTFTDCFIADAGGKNLACKTPTTHYDLSVGFMKGIKELARLYGKPLEAFLAECDSVRYSTTVGTNAVIERTGPKLGLITTAGFEDTIYIGRARSWGDGASLTEMRDQARVQKPEPLIQPDMVVGIRERIDSSGKVVMPLSREDVLRKVQTLVDRGAMGFVVSLLWSFRNPEHERMIKEIIEEEYPEDYLGSLPVILSSDVSAKGGEYPRTMTAVVNAYIHGLMADELNKLSNELRDGGFRRPITLVHNTGGTKKASRTRAVLTHNAGPVAGMYGAVFQGRITGDRNIIFTDMGGTSFDIGVIANGQTRSHDFAPVIDRWRTNIPAIEVKSIGAGGGSIAWINKIMGNTLQVGPRSSGSMPGPACYNQGGEEPTVTDADLVLGFYNPDNYLGGKMSLDPELATDVIKEKIARPLDITVAEAAWRIRRLVDAQMGQEAFNEVALKGHDPRVFSLYACGGAGAAHACNFAGHIGVNRIIVPFSSSVYGAFGASIMNIREIWERSLSLKILRGTDQRYLEDIEAFNRPVRELKELAVRDLRLEGYSENQISFTLDLDMRYGGSQYNLTKVTFSRFELKSAEDYRELCDLFIVRYAEAYSAEAGFPQGGISIEGFRLTAEVIGADKNMPAEKMDEIQPDRKSLKGQRPIYWDPADGYVDTNIFDWAALRPGNQLAGPAVIESPHTTFVVPKGWLFSMDMHRNGIVERVQLNTKAQGRRMEKVL
ncbi:MAG: acetophenone carboxylase [Proteobacteria bacterium]|nr:MAG: acetophenone carboxylase [Pseudomonadota bacterium]